MGPVPTLTEFAQGQLCRAGLHRERGAGLQRFLATPDPPEGAAQRRLNHVVASRAIR